MIIGIDMDETVFPLVESMLEKYNEKYNDSLCIDNITDYHIQPFLKKECENFFQEFATKDTFEALKPYHDALYVVNKLMSDHIVYFVTAGHPETTRMRDVLLNKFFPLYNSGQLIVCRNKSLLKLDILIDDCLSNFDNGEYIGIVIKRPWNKEVKLDSRLNMASSWFEIEKIINFLNLQQKGDIQCK